MAEQTLPEDFKEFLKLLNEAEVRYLLVGGGTPRESVRRRFVGLTLQ
jgi:hypothetical protein